MKEDDPQPRWWEKGMRRRKNGRIVRRQLSWPVDDNYLGRLRA